MIRTLILMIVFGVFVVLVLARLFGPVFARYERMGSDD